MTCRDLADAHADELVLEARDEGAGADIDADVAAGAALERLAVELAGEVDDDAIALLDLGAFALGGVGLVLLGDLVERLVDLGVGDLGGQPLELYAAEVGELDLRQHFERERVGEIDIAGDDALDLRLLVRNGDLRLHGEPEAALLHDLGIHLADHGLNRLGHDRAAIDLAQVRHRDLAGPEAARC